MADKIVQLTDDSNNNIYPVAGSMASGSITTTMLQDGAVTGAKIDLSSLSGNYSTNEQDTGYTWIDGSKIYKKTVRLNGFPDHAGSGIGTPHGISNLDKVVKISGTAYNGSASWLPLPWVSAGTTPAVASITVATTNIMVFANADLSNLTEAYVTLYYTKSA